MAGFIGNSPVLYANEYRQEFTVTESTQSEFHTTGYTTGWITVYRNGVRLSIIEDFTANNGSSVILNTPAVNGDLVSCEFRTDVTEILDQSVSVSKLDLQENSIPISVINVTANSVPISAVDLQANSVPISAVELQANSIPITAVNTSNLNLDAGAKSDVFYENSNVLTESYTISENKNAITAGPITVADGVVVTVPANSVWTVV